MKGIDQIDLIYAGAAGRKSTYDLIPSQLEETKGLVVFAHGYKGFKDWGAWNAVAREFSKAGFDFLKFNFSHGGSTPKEPKDFSDLDAFANNTYSKELEDLGKIMDLCAARDDGGGKNRPLYLIGHSRGGGIAILGTAKDKRIKKLATWAAVADFGERFSHDLDLWKKNGVVYVENARTRQKMPHNYTFYNDFVNNRENLDIGVAAREIEVPWLIVHGTEDESVSPFDADRLYSKTNNAELTFIRGAGHTFGASHPWPTDALPDHLQSAVDKTLAFFEKS